MSRRRLKRREQKARRHTTPSLAPAEPLWPTNPPPPRAEPPRVIVRQASYVERLAYTRSQAAHALGISQSTLRRLLPYLATIELPWGTRLIPVDELERLVAERRRKPVTAGGSNVQPGRKPSVPPTIAERIHAERTTGRSLRAIANDLNTDHIATAQGGKKWWPSTVQAVLQRAN